MTLYDIIIRETTSLGGTLFLDKPLNSVFVIPKAVDGTD